MNDRINCLGVCCNVHGMCARYHAVEFSDPHSLRIGHCPKDEHGCRTLFVPMFVVPAPSVVNERRAAA